MNYRVLAGVRSLIRSKLHGTTRTTMMLWYFHAKVGFLNAQRCASFLRNFPGGNVEENTQFVSCLRTLL